MPTTQSTEYAAKVAAAGNYAAVTVNDRCAKLNFKLIEVPIAADNAALDVITLDELPPGAVVFPELCKIIVSDDMTSGALTIDIGDDTDPDRYCDGANCASVGVVDFLTPAIPDGFLNRYEIPAGDNQLVIATLATFTATIEAGKFHVLLAFATL